MSKHTIGINFEGGKVKVAAVKVAGEKIMQILNSTHNDQKTKRLALQMLGKTFEAEAPKNCTISGSSIDCGDRIGYKENLNEQD